mmetsp:Transcript_135293/g.248386  ORF Transcript_135293/g.248386 Transcript_135293/m.248386 type:complete len:845 (+) Transcript_135293:59-2593(+)
MKTAPEQGEQAPLLLPNLASSGGPTMMAAKVAIDARLSGSTANTPLNLVELGGTRRFDAWLAGLHKLSPQQATNCGPGLWAFIASLVRGLPAVSAAGLVSAFASLAAQIVASLAAAKPALSSNGSSGTGTDATAQIADQITALGSALNAVGEHLQAVTAGCHSGQLQLADGFTACCQLLASFQAARTSAVARAAETWLQGALAAASPGLDKECIRLLDVADEAKVMPLLNLAWRLLKVLCLHQSCEVNVVCAVLSRSASAVSQHLVAAASARPASATATGKSSGGADDALFIATFHCSNFMRIMRDAPTIARGGVPLQAMAAALTPAARAAGDAAAVRARELLCKLVMVMIERWAAAPSADVSDNGHALARDLGVLLDVPTVASSLASSILLQLATSRIQNTDVDKAGTWSPQAQLLLGIALKAMEDGVQKMLYQLRVPDVDALAVLCASGVPTMRPRLLAWTTSGNARLYCSALRIHRAMAKWMSPKAARAWAQLLVEGLLAVGDGPAGGAVPGRSQCQGASCIAVFLSHCPATTASTWMQDALAPLVAVDCRGKAAPTAAWLLARRLTLSMAQGSGQSHLHDVVDRMLGDLGCGSPIQATGLRCLATLTRSGCLSNREQSDAGAALRKMLGDASVPMPVRVEAWVAHAETCLRGGSVDDLRVAFRYAVKHLSGHPAAGSRVAGILARAPSGLLGGAGATLEGLCGVEWPLRIGGLTAAQAVARRSLRADATRASSSDAAAVAAAECALAAFVEECVSSSGSGWASSSGASARTRPLSPHSFRAKRQRLLLEIKELPDVAMGNVDAEANMNKPQLIDLCVAARSRIDRWLRSCDAMPDGCHDS